MEYLKKQNKFLFSINDFAITGNIAILHKLPPDTSAQLSKYRPRYVYSSFYTSNFSGRAMLSEFIRKYQESLVGEIRISTTTNVLRVSNPSYVQNQLVTREVFGLGIDILPRRNRISSYLPVQIVVITPFRFHRYGMEPFTPTFLTQELRDKLNEHNKRFRQQKPNSPSPFA